MTITTEQLTGRLKWCVAKAVMLLAAVCSCTACGSVFDDEGDCDPRYFVRFVYDMNMLRTDAFATQVNSVDLFVFDAETDELVKHLSGEGKELASGSYRMPLDLPPGNYKFIAWCGLADNDEDFALRLNIAQPENLVCTMARSRDEKDNTAYSNRNLHALFHGMLTAELPDQEGEHVYTVKLIKDTNNINLSLQHMAGPLDPARFEVTMVDENGLMAYDNSLMADEQIEYRPWYIDGGTLELQDNTETGTDKKEAGYLKAELSTARLMATRNPRINVLDKDQGKVIFSIPIVQWALKLRSANHAKMDGQEYLDREDEYNLMLILDDDNDAGWIAMEIYINGWHLMTQDNTY